MDALLDRLHEDTECIVKEHFKSYYIKVSESNSSFFVLVKCRREKML